MIARLLGVDINYETHCPDGGASGPTLFMIHGFGASLRTWDRIVPDLARTHPIVAMDLKGFGLSGHPTDGRYSIDHNADLAAALIDHLHLSRLVLVGHSYGGAVASVLAIKLRPRSDVKVEGLVLIDAASYEQRLPFFVDVYRYRVLRWLSRYVPITWGSRFVLRSLFADKTLVDAALVERYAFPRRIPGANASEAQTALQILPANFDAVTKAIRSLDVPTQIIWGERDNAVPAAFAARLHGDIRGSRVDILPGVGHMPQEERPAEVVRIIDAFTATIP